MVNDVVFCFCFCFFFGRHVAGASGFGLVTIRETSNPYVEADMSVDNFETQLVLSGDLTLTSNQWQGVSHIVSDEAGPSYLGAVPARKSKERQRIR